MIKKNKWKLLVTSLVTVLPSVLTLVLWERLSVAMNEKYVSGTKGLLPTLAILPVVLLALQWLCILFTVKDPENKEQNGKVINMVLWIVPLLSVFVYACMLNAILADGNMMEMLISPMMGVLMIVMGNYMPKCSRNSTVGVKIKWTLENDENWYATHRFAGKAQVACGVLLCLGAFLPITWQIAFMLLILIGGMVLPTFLYSYLYYKKQVKNGTYTKDAESLYYYKNKKYFWSSILIVGAILVFCVVICFTGNINVSVGEDALELDASFGEKISIGYSLIDNVEYREVKNVGIRVMGFGSPTLSVGTFKNDEFGSYTCYTYMKTDNCIVLTVEGKTVVFNAIDEETTKALYDELLLKLGKAE